MGKEIIITSLEEMCDLMCDNKIPEEPYICDSCKNKENGWDTEPCDGCCGNHSGYEPTDAVSRKDIQDYIAKYLSQYLYEDVRQAVEVIDAYIGDLPSVNPQKWIPVSERLPEEDGQYLITVKYVPVDGYDNIYAEHGEWSDGKWDMFCFGHCGQVETILAWMPLPEPYKKERSEE